MAKTKKILLVDDSREIRFLLNARLTGTGFDVLEAENGREGIEQAKEHSPDLIITDYSMPEMDGLKASRILKTDPATKNTPIIILSSFPFGKEMIEEIKSIGIDCYMIKPYEFDLLYKKIQELLSKKENESMETSSPEKRRFPRYPTNRMAQVEMDGNKYSAKLLNISRAGFSLVLPKKENIGIDMTVRFASAPEAREETASSSDCFGRARLLWIYQNNRHEYIAGFEMQSSSLS
jgi:CheY-like chemotaxis protein